MAYPPKPQDIPLISQFDYGEKSFGHLRLDESRQHVGALSLKLFPMAGFPIAWCEVNHAHWESSGTYAIPILPQDAPHPL